MRVTEAVARRIRRFMALQPDALGQLEQASLAWDQSVVFVASRHGGWGVTYKGEVLDSTYAPEKAARAVLKSFQPATGAQVCLVGAGGGSLPIALAEQLAPLGQSLLVYEPNPSVLLGLFVFCEEVDHLNAKRVQFISGQTILRDQFAKAQAQGKEIQVLENPAYRRLMPQTPETVQTLHQAAMGQILPDNLFQ